MVENRPCLFVCLLSPQACLLSSVFVLVCFVHLFICLFSSFIHLFVWLVCYHLKLASSPVSDTRRLTAVVDQRDLDKKILSRLKHLTFKFTLRCSAVCSISSIMVKHLSKDSFLWLLFISETWARKFSPGSNILHLNSPFPSHPIHPLLNIVQRCYSYLYMFFLCLLFISIKNLGITEV